MPEEIEADLHDDHPPDGRNQIGLHETRSPAQKGHGEDGQGCNRKQTFAFSDGPVARAVTGSGTCCGMRVPSKTILSGQRRAISQNETPIVAGLPTENRRRYGAGLRPQAPVEPPEHAGPDRLTYIQAASPLRTASARTRDALPVQSRRPPPAAELCSLGPDPTRRRSKASPQAKGPPVEMKGTPVPELGDFAQCGVSTPAVYCAKSGELAKSEMIQVIPWEPNT
jgi:hypothetical protein